MRTRSRLALVCVAAALAAGGAASFAVAAWTSTATVVQGQLQAARLAAPTNLQVTVASCSRNNYFRLRFTWTASNPTTSVAGYEIDAGVVSGGPYDTVAGTVSGATTVSYTTGNLTYWSTTAYAVVRATARGWYSANSPQVGFTTPRANNCN